MLEFLYGLFVLSSLIGFAAATVYKSKIGWSWINNK